MTLDNFQARDLSRMLNLDSTSHSLIDYSSDSILKSRLYLATRSDLDKDPVLI